MSNRNGGVFAVLFLLFHASCGIPAQDHGNGENSALAFEFVRVPGGTFEIGSISAGVEDQLEPVSVSVPSFEIMRKEVTNAQYNQCVEAGACARPAQLPSCDVNAGPRGERRPVTCVTWEDAQAFAEWVGGGARLPSESEWEFAARDRGQPNVYPWGNHPPDCNRTNMGGSSRETPGCGTGAPQESCAKSGDRVPGLGLCDMAGNVSEFVADVFNCDYTCPAVDECCPEGQRLPDDGTARTSGDSSRPHVTRGGNWRLAEHNRFSTTNRFMISPTGFAPSYGFRLARTVEQE